MNAKAAAARRVIEDLPKAKRHLRFLREGATVRDERRLTPIRAQIAETERVLASLPDALERDLVLLRAQGKPWHAIFAETYTSEATGYRRYRKACERLYEPMLDAGLIRKPAPEPPAGKA